MSLMSVALDVSKLSGWLKALAPCPATQGGAYKGRHAGREAGGRGEAAAQAACRRPTGHWGRGTRAKRTVNIQPMSLMLDVSKLSGWLNALAPCPWAHKEAHRGGMRGERREGVGRQRHMQRAGRFQLDIGGEARAKRTKNM